MSLVIDASVFVAASRPSESHYRNSLEFLARLRNSKENVFCPTLVLAECAAAIARTTHNPQLAEQIVRLIETWPDMQLIPLTHTLASQASSLAGQHRLRGADAVYVAVAASNDATLITWDIEMLERSSKAVTTLDPLRWPTPL